MLVSEIFDSIEGEGVRAGQLCTFIRLAGCNLRCSYCDSMYAVDPAKYGGKAKEMSVNEVLAYVNRRYRRVTITGGEPLLFSETVKLADRLCDMGYEVNIETNGSCDIVVFRDMIQHSENLFFTVDFKLPSSGVMYDMRLSNFDNLTPRDVLKLVIGSEEDMSVGLAFAKRIFDQYRSDAPYIYCGVVFGKFELADVIEECKLDKELADIRFQLQMHKYIWDPDLRGV